MYIEFEFQSEYLGRLVRVLLIVPENKRRTREERLPVLYLLHGEENVKWTHYSAVERLAQQYGIAVVMPECGNTFWRTASVTLPEVQYIKGRIEDYEGFLQEELPRTLFCSFPISIDRENSYIAGVSMGGYGAAYHAMHYPGKYDAVGLFSPVLFEQTELLPKPEVAFEELPDVYLRNETKEMQETSAFYVDRLRNAGVRIAEFFGDLSDEWYFEDACIRHFLAWIDARRRKISK